MRKGADVLSKWVGEAERQLRLLFEEAQKNQPAIIFFDEIDGLAPVSTLPFPILQKNPAQQNFLSQLAKLCSRLSAAAKNFFGFSISL